MNKISGVLYFYSIFARKNKLIYNFAYENLYQCIRFGRFEDCLAEAFEIKNDRYKYEALGKHKTCLLIFFNNSLRTRLSTQKAARNLGNGCYRAGCESGCLEAGN